MQECIFCKIARRELPAKFFHDDEDVMAFPDINPMKPVHILIVPKKHIKEFTEVDDAMVYGKIAQVITKLAGQHNLTNSGYKIVVNGGGAQIVDHLHFHLLGPMGKAAAV